MSPDIVTFEVAGGESISDASSLAVLLAESMHCRVVFKFNETPVYAVHGMSARDVENTYWRQRR